MKEAPKLDEGITTVRGQTMGGGGVISDSNEYKRNREPITPGISSGVGPLFALTVLSIGLGVTVNPIATIIPVVALMAPMVIGGTVAGCKKLVSMVTGDKNDGLSEPSPVAITANKPSA